MKECSISQLKSEDTLYIQLKIIELFMQKFDYEQLIIYLRNGNIIALSETEKDIIHDKLLIYTRGIADLQIRRDLQEGKIDDNILRQLINIIKDIVVNCICIHVKEVEKCR